MCYEENVQDILILDELKKEIMDNRVFQQFEEGPICFQPTFKVLAFLPILDKNLNSLLGQMANIHRSGIRSVPSQALGMESMFLSELKNVCAEDGEDSWQHLGSYTTTSMVRQSALEVLH